MRLARFFNRKYDFNHYNCVHFVVEIWQELTGDDIAPYLNGFMQNNGVKKGNITKLKQFVRLSEPKSPCVVLFQNKHQESHIGVFIGNKIIHIQEERGVQYQPLSVVKIGFNRVSFYDI